MMQNVLSGGTLIEVDQVDVLNRTAQRNSIVSNSDRVSDCRVQVAVRVRPFVNKELVDCESSCVKTCLNKIIIGTDKSFEFDRVVDQDASQEEVYEYCVKELLQKYFAGYNATVLAYGQTGSGKTYTMGTSNVNLNDINEMGIIPRVIREIFQIKEDKLKSVEMVLKISYFEIYNDNIIDLLDPNTIPCQTSGQSKKAKTSAANNVFIREEPDGSINLYGITEEKVNSPEEMLAALERGEQHSLEDLYQNSDKNQTSMIAEESDKRKEMGKLEGEGDNMLNEGFKTSKFHFVDLAGSERIKKTGAVGNTLREGININMGLLSLGNVISALTDSSKNGGTKKHIPYRDSKLTRILQDSLGGNSNTLMIACVSPAESNFEESLNSLKYASRARRIKNKPVVNRDPQSALISSLKQQMQEAHQDIQKLKQLLISNNVDIPHSFTFCKSVQDSTDGSCRQNVRVQQDMFMVKQGGQTDRIVMSIGKFTDEGEELKQLRMNLMKMEKRVKELAAENSGLKSYSYKAEIDILIIQRERDELRLKLEKLVSIAKEKGVFLLLPRTTTDMEVEPSFNDQYLESQRDGEYDLLIDPQQRSLIEEYCCNVEKLKKELQKKDQEYRELQVEFDEGIRSSLRDQQMLVEKELKIANLLRTCKKNENENKKTKANFVEAKKELLFNTVSRKDSKKVQRIEVTQILQRENTEKEEETGLDNIGEDGLDDSEEEMMMMMDAEGLERMQQDTELVEMESQLKMEEKQKQQKLVQVDGSISQTSETMRLLNKEQLILQQQLLKKMKEQYHQKINNLEEEMRQTEEERDIAIQKLSSMNTKDVMGEKQRVIESYKQKVVEMQVKLKDYKVNAREQETLQKTVHNQEKVICQLGSEINKFKQTKITLCKEMKKSQQEFEKFKLKRYKDLMQEKRKIREKERQIFRLENQTKKQERLLQRKQEDIKRLTRSRDLIKKIISSSCLVSTKNRRGQLNVSTVSQGNGQLQIRPLSEGYIREDSSIETTLDLCLCKLIESVEVNLNIEKGEDEIQQVLQELEEAQRKLVCFKVNFEKKEYTLNELALTQDVSDQQQQELCQQRMELEEMQSRLDSLEANYEFKKIKITELYNDERSSNFTNLQNQLLTSPQYNNVHALKIVVSNLLDRFGSSSAVSLRNQEQIDLLHLQIEDASQFILLLQSQKNVLQGHIDELEDQLQSLTFPQISNRPSHSDSDSDNNRSHDYYHGRPSISSHFQQGEELSHRKISKIKCSPFKKIAMHNYKSLRIAYQNEQSPFKKELKNEDSQKLQQKQINDLTKQLKQNEIRVKTLQNRNETLQQKYDDIKKSTCKDKFIGINKTIENDESFPLCVSSTFIGLPQQVNLPFPLQQIGSPFVQFQPPLSQQQQMLTSLKDRRRETKGKGHLNMSQKNTNNNSPRLAQIVQIPSESVQMEISLNESQEEKSLSQQYSILDIVTNHEQALSAMTNSLNRQPHSTFTSLSVQKKHLILTPSLSQPPQSDIHYPQHLNYSSRKSIVNVLESRSTKQNNEDEITLFQKNTSARSGEENLASYDFPHVSPYSTTEEVNQITHPLLFSGILNQMGIDISAQSHNNIAPSGHSEYTSPTPNNINHMISNSFTNSAMGNSQERDKYQYSNGLSSPSEESGIACKYECVGKINDAHNGQIFCVESYENILYSTSVKTLKIWDLETLKCTSDIQAHTHFVKGLAILDQQRWIATACDKYINIWDMVSLNKICTLTGHNVEIKQLYADSSNVLYSAGKGTNNHGALVMWDMRKQQVIEEREKNQDIFSVLPYNNMIYYASRDHFVRRINVETNISIDPFKPPHYDAVTSLAILNGYLVSGSKDHNLKLWNTNPTNTQVKEQTYYSNEQFMCLESNKDRNLLYAGQKDGKIKVVTTQNNKFKEVSDINNGLQSVNCISQISNKAQENMFACGTADKIIKLWKPTSESSYQLALLKNQTQNENYHNYANQETSSFQPTSIDNNNLMEAE